VPGPRDSYDKIVRRTVVEPDGGFQPSRDEEQEARHRTGEPTEHLSHHMTQAERDTLARVQAALRAESIDLSDVHLGIDDRELVVTGTVPGAATSARIEDIAGGVDGVERIDNQLIVRGAQ
jgi:osmotically-inducible protein OsmY